MPRYRVTLRRTTTEIVEASNPYQAAIVANDGGAGPVEVVDVRPAVGRPGVGVAVKSNSSKVTKKVAKKRKPLSPEARAKLAQNLIKARAARARNVKAAKKTTKRTAKKSPAKKTARAAKKR